MSFSIRRAAVSRWSRYLHAWVSAFAFFILMFFAFSGFLLNHSDWFKSDAKVTGEQQLVLPAELKVKWTEQKQPAVAILKYLSEQGITIAGTPPRRMEIEDQVISFDVRSPYNVTSVKTDLANNTIDVVHKKSPVISVLRDLHKGKSAAKPWKLAIDVGAILVIFLCISGFILLFIHAQQRMLRVTITVFALLSIIVLLLFGVQ